VTITGNLTRDPELRFTPSGQATASFGGWRSTDAAESPRPRSGTKPTSFFDVVCWGQLAENTAQSLGRGSRVVVERTPRPAAAGRPLKEIVVEDRDHRRRGRAEPALGHRRHLEKKRAARPRWGRLSKRRGRPRRQCQLRRRGQRRRPEPPAANQAPDGYQYERGAVLSMARNAEQDRARRAPWRPSDPTTRHKLCALCADPASWVDYKEHPAVASAFVSDRGAHPCGRAQRDLRRHQREVQIAVKTARELAVAALRPARRRDRGPDLPGGPGGVSGRGSHSTPARTPPGFPPGAGDPEKTPKKN